MFNCYFFNYSFVIIRRLPRTLKSFTGSFAYIVPPELPLGQVNRTTLIFYGPI